MAKDVVGSELDTRHRRRTRRESKSKKTDSRTVGWKEGRKSLFVVSFLAFFFFLVFIPQDRGKAIPKEQMHPATRKERVVEGGRPAP